MKLYISHGGGPNVDWFIVEPRDAPEAQVAALREAGRTVIEIDAEPYADQHVRLHHDIGSTVTVDVAHSRYRVGSGDWGDICRPDGVEGYIRMLTNLGWVKEVPS